VVGRTRARVARAFSLLCVCDAAPQTHPLFFPRRQGAAKDPLFQRVWEAAKNARLIAVDVRAGKLGKLFAALPEQPPASGNVSNADTLAAAVMAEYDKDPDRPLFLYVDEAGALEDAPLLDLRKGVAEVYALMHARVHAAGSDGALPLIFFFVTGKGLHYKNLDVGHPLSPLGTAWITLEMLAPNHIAEIRRLLTLNHGLCLTVRQCVCLFGCACQGGSGRTYRCCAREDGRRRRRCHRRRRSRRSRRRSRSRSRSRSRGGATAAATTPASAAVAAAAAADQ
jgi:hypothetical protein